MFLASEMDEKFGVAVDGGFSFGKGSVVVRLGTATLESWLGEGSGGSGLCALAGDGGPDVALS